MIYVLMTIISLIPVMGLGYYIYTKDTVKEPKTLLIGLFASGFLAAFLVVLFNIVLVLLLPDYYLLDNNTNFSRVELFTLIFFEIAFIEELAKWLMVKIFGYNNQEFDQFYDIIVYAVFISLGFAAVENIFYVVPEANIGLGIFRAIFSVPAHAAFGVYMGYFFARAKMIEGYDNFKYFMNMLSALFIPAVFHTIYNFCLMTENDLYLIIFILFIIVLYLTAFVEVNRASRSGTKVK